ncbi:MAG: SLC13 family permease [Gammaproteobacteria bacterium]|nr:SLC13 family permease [Gammaproteobacteria bacterium]MDH5653373.1 SLC13 family permease [Gammaproteobacteria bacterium]
MSIPVIPNHHALAVMLLTAFALWLFTREHIPLQTSSLAILVALCVGFEVFPFHVHGRPLAAVDFFSGFGHEALIAVSALMVVGHGLIRTGALEPFGRMLSRLWSITPVFSLLLTLLFGAVLSAFVNNVPIVILLLPILISVSLRTHSKASAVLMPMGFATLIGGMGTTIGTSTNLLVVSIAGDMGLPRFGMFDFLLPVSIAGGIAILYLWLIAPHLLPERETQLADTSPRIFAAQLKVGEESYANQRTLAEVLEKSGAGMRVTRIRRGPDNFLMPLPDVVLQSGDLLHLRDTPERLKEFEQVLGATLFAGDTQVDEENPLAAEDQQLAEIIVAQGSPLENSTVAQLHFSDRYQLLPIALHRPGRQTLTLQTEIAEVRLQVGDILLVQGASEQIAEVKRKGDLLVLDATADLPHTSRAPIALAIMAAVILVAAIGVLPIAISAVAGILLMLLTRCLGWNDVARALNAQVILIVVVSLALGDALLGTGAADYMAKVFVVLTEGYSPQVMLSGLMLLMAFMTNVVSNNAAAVIGTPVAIGIAQQLNIPAEPFVLAVLFGANMSYATPMAYKTNLLVMSAGGYRFSDFLRVGIPLTVIMWLSLSWLLAKIYLTG